MGNDRAQSIQQSLAVLLTCFNRKQKTLESLGDLFSQTLPAEIAMQVYLVDDGSTDGTAEAVSAAFPQVNVIRGSGNLFWNRGMYLAFAEAMQVGHDYYLWLNDDTCLYPNAISSLLITSKQLEGQGKPNSIVVGSTCDPTDGTTTYGGVVRSSWWHPFHHRLLEPSQEPQACQTMNGNCVLIPQSVVKRVGNLDPAFTHYAGDYDYGLRAQKHGCPVWIAPGHIGTCGLSAPERLKQNSTLSTSHKHWEKVDHPKGIRTDDIDLHPFSEWKVFSQRHGGLLWPIYWLIPYRRLLWLSMGATVGKLVKTQA
jgi:GT2 family glycosyltransferase